MKTEAEFPQTLMEAIRYFDDGDNAFEFMKQLRWPNGVCCPRCGSNDVGFISTRKMWECHNCETKRQFTVKVGTIFEDSALPLAKWLATIWLLANAKNGISSYEVARSIGVTQKTGWFMLQRIRLAMQTGSFEKFKGDVEADESWIGARHRNMHTKTKAMRGIDGNSRGHSGKQVVMGIMERGGKIKTVHVQKPGKTILQAEVKKAVEPGSNLYTDALQSYVGLRGEYNHEAVDHHFGEWVRGKVHVNSLENFWSLLKRTLKGTYVAVDPAHLFRYLDEQVFRFNARKTTDPVRFLLAAGSIVGKRLTYEELINGAYKA